jgi:hypothetical protein
VCDCQVFLEGDGCLFWKGTCNKATTQQLVSYRNVKGIYSEAIHLPQQSSDIRHLGISWTGTKGLKRISDETEANVT